MIHAGTEIVHTPYQVSSLWAIISVSLLEKAEGASTLTIHGILPQSYCFDALDSVSFQNEQSQTESSRESVTRRDVLSFQCVVAAPSLGMILLCRRSSKIRLEEWTAKCPKYALATYEAEAEASAITFYCQRKVDFILWSDFRYLTRVVHLIPWVNAWWPYPASNLLIKDGTLQIWISRSSCKPNEEWRRLKVLPVQILDMHYSDVWEEVQTITSNPRSRMAAWPLLNAKLNDTKVMKEEMNISPSLNRLWNKENNKGKSGQQRHSQMELFLALSHDWTLAQPCL
jgi:hypothetical protein